MRIGLLLGGDFIYTPNAFTQHQILQSETAEAVRQYLNTCALDGLPAYAAGWRLVSALYGGLFAVRHLNVRHVIRGLLRTTR